jgi:hypothetical protein
LCRDFLEESIYPLSLNVELSMFKETHSRRMQANPYTTAGVAAIERENAAAR